MSQDNSKWRAWLETLSEGERDTIRDAAISRLIEIDEVRFREQDDTPGYECKATLYWESCGDDLRD